MKDKVKILLAEDDVNLGFLLVDFLEMKGYEVKLYKDGKSALNGFQNIKFDFCVLDIMMPEMDGYTLAKEIKKQNETVPIIFLTAKSQKQDKLKGYGLRVDDYITKPFDEDELLCKIQAILRRVKGKLGDSSTEGYQVGGYAIDKKSRTLYFKEQEVKRLTAKEFAVLSLLCESKNAVVEREQILNQVWGENDYFVGRSLDVFVTKLRKYLQDDPNVKIESIPSLGLILSDGAR